MRLAIAPSAGVALWGSEGTAVEVPIPGSNGARFILRLDSVNGQVVEVKARTRAAAAAHAAKLRAAPNAMSNIGHASAAKVAARGGGPRAREPFIAEWDTFQLRSFDLSRGSLLEGEEVCSMFRAFGPLSIEVTPRSVATQSGRPLTHWCLDSYHFLVICLSFVYHRCQGRPCFTRHPSHT